jgi:hypothetical protein
MKHLAPDKASLIALLLIERPMCLDCICEKVGVSTIEGDRYLTTIGAALALQRSEEQCSRCGKTSPVYSLNHPEK